MSEEQEEAVESPEEQADETPADEQEEGRLHFVKQPNNAAKEAADQPPAPVKPKKKAPPAPAVKSAAMHPIEAFLNRWVGELAPQLISAPSKAQKREIVQKALYAFRDGVLEVINATTSTTAEDIEQVVNDQVSKALEAQQQQSSAQIAALEAQVKSLMKRAVEGEIEGMSRRGGRKSLDTSAKPPMAKSQANGQEVLAGDTQVKTGFSASEVVKATVSQNPLFHY